MDAEEYRRRGKEMVDYIADYIQNIRQRRVFPNVKPGYMRNLLSESAPYEGEPWDKIFNDVERIIMPGVTHWQSPYMHAYFPALNSFPSLLGDMLADAINCLGFTWASSPACTELESIVMDWLGKMIGLPEQFLHTKPNSKGGGVIQTTASEATFVCLLAARTEAIRRYSSQFPDLEDAEINSRLVAYCSDQIIRLQMGLLNCRQTIVSELKHAAEKQTDYQISDTAHSSVEKAGLMGLVKMRYIDSDFRMSLRGDKLAEAIRRDRDKGLIPFFLCATLGTTGCCAFDNLKELGPICKQDDIWIHVDAAYAGTAFICPEFRKWLTGIEHANSIAFNPSKWMMVHFDCTAMWVTNSETLHRTFNVDPLYLKHENSGLAIDYMHWQIALSKRFRSLKLWFVIRNFGIIGLQAHIRKGVQLAAIFENLVRADKWFEVPAERHLGMVVFKLKGENQLTEILLKKLNSSGKLHCVPASLKGTYVIRFTVTSWQTTEEDILRDWSIIREVAYEILDVHPENPTERARVNVSEIKKNQPEFGTSLLLANSPMSPKVVNGSYVAIFDNHDAIREFAKKFRNLSFDVKGSPAIRCRIRGMLMTGKQYSLDSRMDLVQTIVGSTLPCTREDSIEADTHDPSTGLTVKETHLIGPAADKSIQTSPDGNSSAGGNGMSRVRSRSVGDDRIATIAGRPVQAAEPSEEVIEENGTTDNEDEVICADSEMISKPKVCNKCGHVISSP